MTEMEVIKTWKQFENEPSVYRTIQAFAREIRRQTREECVKRIMNVPVLVEGNHEYTALIVQNECVKSIRAMEN